MRPSAPSSSRLAERWRPSKLHWSPFSKPRLPRLPPPPHHHCLRGTSSVPHSPPRSPHTTHWHCLSRNLQAPSCPPPRPHHPSWTSAPVSRERAGPHQGWTCQSTELSGWVGAPKAAPEVLEEWATGESSGGATCQQTTAEPSPVRLGRTTRRTPKR